MEMIGKAPYDNVFESIEGEDFEGQNVSLPAVQSLVRRKSLTVALRFEYKGVIVTMNSP